MTAHIARRASFILTLSLCVSCTISIDTESKRDRLEQRNLEVGRRYVDFYNTDIEKFAETYTEDCLVNGGVHKNRGELLTSEKRFLAFAPNRKMRLVQMHVAGDVVTVQGQIIDPDRGDDWQVPFCAVLTIRDGLIATDWTYAEFSKLAER